MSSRLQQYLFDAYKDSHTMYLSRKLLRTSPLQIDDQDDNDSLTEFCNIFCTIGPKDRMTVELTGRFPITQEMADLVEIYNGTADSSSGKLMVQLTTDQIEVLRDLSDKIRKTTFLGDQVNNPAWLSVSSRTISSLYRFIRIIKGYRQAG